MDFFSTISSAFHQGGIWMYAILAAQIVSIAIMIERIYALYIKRKCIHQQQAKSLETEIKKGHIENVLNLSSQLPPSLSPVVRAGAQAALDRGGREEIQAKMDEVLFAENVQLEKRTNFLATVGNVGTLLGLLGTVVGMIESFSSVSNVNPVEKATILSRGISMAMHSTAYGLIVAIPALVMYSVLQNRANTLSEDLNQAALHIFNWLSFNYEPVTRRKIHST